MPNARAACAAVCSPARTSRIAAARRWADAGASRPRSEYGGGLLRLPWLWLRIGPPAFVGDFLGRVYLTLVPGSRRGGLFESEVKFEAVEPGHTGIDMLGGKFVREALVVGAE